MEGTDGPDVTALKAQLAARRLPTAEDINKLEPRKREELEFHDDDRTDGAQTENDHSNRRFYTTTRRSVTYIDQWLKRVVPGKVFLDYGCGNGLMAIRAAKLGAALAVGIDISPVSVENANKRAAAEGVSDRCTFIQGDCENTELPPASFDAIMCGGMLHHVDLTQAYPELRRIMKPGGRALGVEALAYNPIIQRYRNRTPHLRTKWETEHILSMKDIELAKRFFEVQDVRHWHLFSLAAVAAPAAFGLKSLILSLGETIDDVVLKIPGVRLMSWQFSFEFVKPR